jgi:antibiotic biosynthesis monooxygenase (ABM) superfamily enzyme
MNRFRLAVLTRLGAYPVITVQLMTFALQPLMWRMFSGWVAGQGGAGR